MIWIGGHSLGAARAFEYAYSRVERQLPLDGIYACGSPRPGNGALAEAFPPSVRIRSIKNGRDLVTAVPLDIPELNEEFVDGAPFEHGNEAPLAGDPWGPLAWHHTELYQAAARRLPPSNEPIELVQAVDEMARLYATTDGWDWIDTTDGQYAAMKAFGSDKLLLFRGSTTPLDWLNDFEAWQVNALRARVSFGFWRGVGPIMEKLDAALAA